MLPQMAPMGGIEGQTGENQRLSPITPTDKIIVAAAGPVFSFGLAVALAILVWAVGRPVSAADMTTQVGYVFLDSPAARAGILPGDIITEVDGMPVSRFAATGDVGETINWNIATTPKDTIPIVVNRNSEFLVLNVSPEAPAREGMGRKYLKQIGVLPASIPMVARVLPGSPAAKSGISSGDVLLSVNGQPLYSVLQVRDVLDKQKDPEPLEFAIRRNGNITAINVLPVLAADGSRLGIEWDQRGETAIYHESPVEQVYGSVASVFKTVEALFTKKSGVTVSHLSGPVGILHVYYLLFESPGGWMLVLWFSVLLNVNLAIMNMLPLPVLDGGHIAMAIVEVLSGREIPYKAQKLMGTACAFILLGFMAYVTFYDVLDIL